MESHIRKLEKWLSEYDKVILVVDGSGPARNLTKEITSYICSCKHLKNILILSGNAETPTEESNNIRKISKEEEECFVGLYRLYDFSDRFLVLMDTEQYGTILNYVKSDLLTLNDVFGVLIE